MKLKLTEQGVALNNEWYEKYCSENDKLGGNSAKGDFVEGWCIIDNSDYVKNLTDVCGLFIFGYDSGFGWSAVDTIDEWIEDYGAADNAYGFSLKEIRTELLKYYVVEE